MQTTDRMKHGITASETGVKNVFNPFSQTFAPFGVPQESETFDFNNQNIVEFNKHQSENLLAKVGKGFNQSTALVVVVDSPDSIPIIEWVEDFNLEIPYLKPYPNSTVLDNNSTLLREMLSEIDGLLMNEYDWDEIDYRKPTLEDLNFAKDTLIKFVTVIGCYGGYLLTKPYISNSEDGGAKFEWHSNDRSLYLRINRFESVATKIEDELDGTTTIVDKPVLQQDYLSLWKWIINEQSYLC